MKLAVKIISVLLVILMTLFTVACDMFSFGTSTYEIPPVTCKSYFGCAPAEFIYNDFDFYETTKDFRKNSTVDSQGNLVLTLNRKQKDAWLQSGMLTDFSKYENIEVSSDYKTITVYAFPETAYNTISDAAIVLDKCCMIQKLNGISTYQIQYNIIDATNDKVIYTTTYPPNDIDFKGMEDYFVIWAEAKINKPLKNTLNSHYDYDYYELIGYFLVQTDEMTVDIVCVVQTDIGVDILSYVSYDDCKTGTIKTHFENIELTNGASYCIKRVTWIDYVGFTIVDSVDDIPLNTHTYAVSNLNNQIRYICVDYIGNTPRN